MRIHISLWVLVGLVATALVVSVLASQGWIDVEVFKAIISLFTESAD